MDACARSHTRRRKVESRQEIYDWTEAGNFQNDVDSAVTRFCWAFFRIFSQWDIARPHSCQHVFYCGRAFLAWCDMIRKAHRYFRPAFFIVLLMSLSFYCFELFFQFFFADISSECMFIAPFDRPSVHQILHDGAEGRAGIPGLPSPRKALQEPEAQETIPSAFTHWECNGVS